jgi:hypothetical protein
MFTQKVKCLYLQYPNNENIEKKVVETHFWHGAA